MQHKLLLLSLLLTCSRAFQFPAVQTIITVRKNNNNKKNHSKTRREDGKQLSQTMNSQDDDTVAAASAFVTTEQRQQMLRDILPNQQPQEGSPANTFTVSELQELQAALAIDTDSSSNQAAVAVGGAAKVDITSESWFQKPATAATQQYKDPVAFRQAVRQGIFQGPTNGVCPGRLQINLVVLPAGQVAFDFLLFCQRNSKACPLLEVCEGATTSFIPKQLATGADLRTDVPK